MLPAGTATGSVDAVRAAAIVPSFFLTANVLGGTDSAARMEQGMSTSNNGLLGPSSSYSVDFGVDATGAPYVRGQVANDEAPPSNTAIDGQVATTMGVPTLLLLAVAAWLLFKLAK